MGHIPWRSVASFGGKGLIFVNRLLSVLRSLVAYSLGLMAIHLFHLAASPFLPKVYATLDSDPMRLAMVALVAFAGIIACFVVATVAGHRPWRDMALFMAIMVVVDIDVLLGDWAPQPLWFKVAIIAVIPLQVWLGARLAVGAPRDKATN